MFGDGAALFNLCTEGLLNVVVVVVVQLVASEGSLLSESQVPELLTQVVAPDRSHVPEEAHPTSAPYELSFNYDSR